MKKIIQWKASLFLEENKSLWWEVQTMVLQSIKI